jgi:hypothetical protein
MKYILLLLLITFVSCQKESTPEGSLEKLVSTRFSSSSRDDVMEVVTGKLKTQIESMNDEKIEHFLDSEGLKKRKLKITLKNCEKNKCFLTYILKYADVRPQGSKFEIEVKKIAQIELIGETWLVSDINNLKTYIDSKDPIDTK